ncbi:UPF0415 protein C7orf25 homolog isoform X2 [Zootermopsis nevadensis]|uniref:DUF1308 domain-containing protein n=1 Tax=Zootermopsis nevadensis TaxID=136037 RepID=A0A067QNK2_ZOONE|nr:UPF0415 protein C7orf25 homolog isoform X2 [Zootermopsis nevadensis]KDR11077.1 hypothetical protein L798_14662 [Zootermopsis nevadensis]
MAHEDVLINLLEEKILDGEKLLTTVSIINVNGIEKLQKKFEQEIQFLLKVTKSKKAKKEHLLCTNLSHFEALVSCLVGSYDPVAVLQTFVLTKSDGSSKRICVDIVAEKGQQWIKVIARNPKALSQLSTGEGEFGQRSIVDHAVEYTECAHQHPHIFKTPKVVFQFACGIEKTLADRLDSLGIIVSGRRLGNSELLLQEGDCVSANDDDDLQTCVSKRYADVHCSIVNSGTSSVINCNHDDQKLNLDVTAMLAYVSGLTNGRCNFKFKEPVLTQQAEWERAKPVKPVLDQLFEGKSLFCCESAVKDFQSIVSTLGGPGEVSRANELLARITVIPDMTSLRAQAQLKLGGKIKQRSLAVFGTGDAVRAVTVSANAGFVRAAKCQGVEFAVFVHESRALTEGKEHDARALVLTCDSKIQPVGSDVNRR